MYVMRREFALGTPFALTERINFPLKSYTSNWESVARLDRLFWRCKTNDRLSGDQHMLANRI